MSATRNTEGQQLLLEALFGGRYHDWLTDFPIWAEANPSYDFWLSKRVVEKWKESDDPAAQEAYNLAVLMRLKGIVSFH